MTTLLIGKRYSFGFGVERYLYPDIEFDILGVRVMRCENWMPFLLVHVGLLSPETVAGQDYSQSCRSVKKCSSMKHATNTLH